jgi:type IV pilus assembly protein PilE
MKSAPAALGRGFNEARMNMKTESGFSMIELMIVILIIGILFGISLPAYQNYTLKAHRTDAHNSLLDLATRQERFLTQNNTYTTEIEGFPGLNLGNTTSRDGYYSLTVEACDTGTIQTCYRIIATAIGTQAADTECPKITYGSNGAKPSAEADCW